MKPACPFTFGPWHINLELQDGFIRRILSISLINQQIFINHGISLSLVPSEKFRTLMVRYPVLLAHISGFHCPHSYSHGTRAIFISSPLTDIQSRSLGSKGESISVLYLSSVKFHLFFSWQTNKRTNKNFIFTSKVKHKMDGGTWSDNSNFQSSSVPLRLD